MCELYVARDAYFHGSGVFFCLNYIMYIILIAAVVIEHINIRISIRDRGTYN